MMETGKLYRIKLTSLFVDRAADSGGLVKLEAGDVVMLVDTDASDLSCRVLFGEKIYIKAFYSFPNKSWSLRDYFVGFFEPVGNK